MPAYSKQDLRNYLLGEYESLGQEFERALFTDDEMFEALEAEEEELMQEYADGELDPVDEAKFLKHTARSKAAIERMRFASSLRRVIDRDD